jgi:hypothetical protein
MATIFKNATTYSYTVLTRGLLLLAFSFTPYLLETHQRTTVIIMLAYALFCFGVIDIFEFITLKLANISLKQSIYKNKKTLIKFLAVGFFGGILVDGVFQWLAKAWVYPFWNTLLYSLIFALGFAVYFLTLMESYLAFKVLFDKILKGKKFVTKPSRFDKIILKLLLFLGIPFILLGIYLLLSNYKDIGYVFSLNEKVPLNELVNFMGVFFTFVGASFVIEYLLHRNKKVTFLQTLTHSYFSPILAVITGSFLLLVLMESQNGITLLWEYDNVIFGDIKVFFIPILGVIAWPFHYIPIIDLYALIFGDDEIHLLSGDKIE